MNKTDKYLKQGNKAILDASGNKVYTQDDLYKELAILRRKVRLCKRELVGGK